MNAPSCPVCLGGAMIASTPLGTWRCPCGAALTVKDDVRVHDTCDVHHLPMTTPGLCPLCESAASDEEELDRFHDAAVLHSIGTAARSLLAWGAQSFTPAELAAHAVQIADEVTERRQLRRQALAEKQDLGRLDTELKLLRAVATDAFQLFEARDDKNVLQRLGLRLADWVTDYEAPRMGVTAESIPPGTNVVDISAALRDKWRPHT